MWQVYLQVLTPSGTSGGTGDAPGTVGLRLEFPTWPNLEEKEEEEEEET